MFTMRVVIQRRLSREIVAFLCGDIKKIDIVLGKLVQLTLLWGGSAWTT